MCMRVTYHSPLVGAASVLAFLFLRRARLVGRAWWGGPSAGFFLTARRRTRRACLWRHPPRAASSAPPAAAPHARPAAPLGTALACLLRFASTAPVGPALPSTFPAPELARSRRAASPLLGSGPVPRAGPSSISCTTPLVGAGPSRISREVAPPTTSQACKSAGGVDAVEVGGAGSGRFFRRYSNLNVTFDCGKDGPSGATFAWAR